MSTGVSGLSHSGYLATEWRQHIAGRANARWKSSFTPPGPSRWRRPSRRNRDGPGDVFAHSQPGAYAPGSVLPSLRD